MRLGLHMDMRLGYGGALRAAEALDCRAMQMLTYRRHHEPTADELSDFRRDRARSQIERLALHVRFLPGLGSADAARRRRSVELLAREVRLARELGGDWLVLHLGAYSPGSSARAGMAWFADGMRAALEEAGGGLPLVVENVPGGGRRMGGALEELAAFRDLAAARGMRVPVCLDSAHAWAQGYALNGAEGVDAFLDRAAALFGAADVPLLHLNDSRARRGSHREHHWHWGDGALGEACLRALLARRDFAGAAGILEMPPGRDVENLEFAQKCRED